MGKIIHFGETTACGVAYLGLDLSMPSAHGLSPSFASTSYSRFMKTRLFFSSLLAGAFLPASAPAQAPQGPAATPRQQSVKVTAGKPADAVKPSAQILVPQVGLSRLAPVEIRFQHPMVPDGSVGGSVDAASVLSIAPPLKGTFQWRSRYSGAFLPAEVPALGAHYLLSLASGLKDGEGTPVSADPVKASAPGFVIRESFPRWFSEINRTPAILVYFNDHVDVKKLAALAGFVDKSGRKVPVAVTSPLPKELPSGAVPVGTYLEQAMNDTKPRQAGKPLPSVARITPQQPLPPGENWRLVIEAGVANAAGRAVLATPFALNYGNILAMSLRDITAESPMDTDRVLTISFSKALPKGAPVAAVQRFVSITPLPEDAVWEVAGHAVTISGSWETETDYHVEVRPGLASMDGLLLDKGGEQTLRFLPAAPALALGAFDHIQWVGGRREFEVIAGNCDPVRVQIKRVDPQNMVYALRGYQAYQHDESGEGGFTRIPFPAVPGKAVWEKRFKSEADIDHTEHFKFTWEEALGGKTPGMYFVSVEGTPKEGVENGKKIGAQSLIQLTDIGLAWKFTAREATVYAFSHTTGKPLGEVRLTSFDDDSNPLENATTNAQGLAVLKMTKSARWLMAAGAGDWHGIEFSESMDRLDMWDMDVAFEENGGSAKRNTLIFTDRPVYQPGETVFLKAITRQHGPDGLALHPNRKARLIATDPQHRMFLTKDVVVNETGSFADQIKLPENGVGAYHIRLQFFKSPEQIKAEKEQRRREAEENGEAIEEEGAGEGAAAGAALGAEAGNGDADAEGSEEAAAADDAGSEEESSDEEEAEDISVESTVYHYVLVQEYQPNSFRITFDGTAARKDGETLNVPVRAAYFMGKALSEATLKWNSSISQQRFYPEKFGDYEFCHAKSYHAYDGDEWRQLSREEWQVPLATGQGEIKLSPKGEAVVPAKVPATFGVPGPKEVSVQAEITDLNQQTISETYNRVEHTSDFYLGIKHGKGRHAYHAGTEIPIQMVAVQPNGKRHDQAVAVKLLVERLQWNAVKIQTAGGGTEIRHDLSSLKEMESDVALNPAIGQELAATFKPRAAGTYNVTAIARDAEGREVKTIISFDVYGGDAGTWAQQDGVKIELQPDQDSYKAGDTAKIIVKSPFKGQALISVERDRVLKTWLAEVDGNGGVVEVPVEESFAPNCYVSVLQVRGGAEDPREFKEPDYKVGFCELEVESQKNTLTVELQPVQPEILPGSESSASVLVKDSAGKPLANAEVAVWAVDEGILSLVTYEAPNPDQAFHYRESLSVTTGVSLSNLLPENPEQRDYSNKGFVIGGGGDGVGELGQDLRKNFKPLAFWESSLRTGPDGRVSVKFTAPDNLTKFRLLAVVNEGTSRFGVAEGKFKVNKPLMLEPALPRFANVGDEVLLKAVLHNTTQQAGEFEIKLQLNEHLEFAQEPGAAAPAGNGLVKTASIAGGQSRAVFFPVRFVKMGSGMLKWSATGKGGAAALADAVQNTVTIGTTEPMLRDVHFVTVSEDAKGRNLLENLRPELLDAEGSLDIELSNSRLLEAAEAIDQLLEYPYGCAEQTTSAMLPWVALGGGLRKAIPQLDRTDAQIAAVTQKSVDHLLAMQTRSGGLGYWPRSSEPSLWASAHGGMGLVLAQKSGANIPQPRLDSLLKYLSKSLRKTAAGNNEWNTMERTLAAYTLALAGKAEPAYHEVLFQKRAELPSSARSLLALAIAQSGGPAEMIRKLLEPGPAASQWDWLGDASEEAVHVLVYLKLKDAAKTEAAMDHLLRRRSARGDWQNTFNNAWVLLALAEYSKDQTPWKAEDPALVAFNGKEQKLVFGPSPLGQKLAYSTQGGGKLPALNVSVPAGRKLYVRVEAKARATKGLDRERAAGFAIARTYQKLDPKGAPQPGDLKVGDLVLVNLTLDVPGDSEYLAIDDPLPATLEGVNPEFKSMAANPRAGVQPMNWWVYDHQEMRRDRVLFFRDQFSGNGRFNLQYLARVVSAGTVTAPAAKIEAMYDPAKFGLCPQEKLTTLPGDELEMATR